MAKKFVINIINGKQRVASIIYDNKGYYDDAIECLSDLSNIVMDAERKREDPIVAIYRYLVANGGGLRDIIMDKAAFSKQFPGTECRVGNPEFGLMTVCQGGFDSFDSCKSYANFNIRTHDIEHNVLPDETRAQLMEEDDIDPFHFSCETAQTLYEYAQSVYNS